MRTFGKLVLTTVLTFNLICDVTYTKVPKGWGKCPKSVHNDYNKNKKTLFSLWKKDKVAPSDASTELPETLCENGGTCILKPLVGKSSAESTKLNTSALLLQGLIKCVCPLGFSGQRCEYEVCSPSTCKNGGTCEETFPRSRNERPDVDCKCLPKYEGRRCEKRAPTEVKYTCKQGAKSSETVNCIHGECVKYKTAEKRWARLIHKHGMKDVKAFVIKFYDDKPSNVTTKKYLVCLCKLGWTGDECDVSCFDRKRYGDYCLHDCPYCIFPTTCDPVTGKCNTNVPTVKCVEGENCFNGKCEERTHLDGNKSKVCVCEPGFRGSRCNDECEAGTYGLSCRESCGRCLRPPCRTDNGHCEWCRGPFKPPLCKELLVGSRTRAQGNVILRGESSDLDVLIVLVEEDEVFADGESRSTLREKLPTKRNLQQNTRSPAREILAGVIKFLTTGGKKISPNSVISGLKFEKGEESARKRDVKRQADGNTLQTEFSLDFPSNEVDENGLKDNLAKSLKEASDEVEIPGATVDKDSIQIRAVSIVSASNDDGTMTAVLIGAVVVVGVFIIVSIVVIVIFNRKKKSHKEVMKKQQSRHPSKHGSTTKKSMSRSSSTKGSRRVSLSKSNTSHHA